MRFLIALPFLLLASAVSAVTIDFEDATGGASPRIAGGYIFSTDPAETNLGPVAGPSGNALFYCPWCDLRIENGSGSLFKLQSFDYESYGTGVTGLGITGLYNDGSVVYQEFALAVGFSTYNFDSAWNNLEAVVISQVGGTGDGVGQLLDNVVVSSVPIPAAVWLFGSALAGLGWLRRKQTV